MYNPSYSDDSVENRGCDTCDTPAYDPNACENCPVWEQFRQNNVKRVQERG